MIIAGGGMQCESSMLPVVSCALTYRECIRSRPDAYVILQISSGVASHVHLDPLNLHSPLSTVLIRLRLENIS